MGELFRRFRWDPRPVRSPARLFSAFQDVQFQFLAGQPARAWFTPRMSGGTAWEMLLDGAWRFRYDRAPLEAGLYVLAPDFDDSRWDLIPVPSNWQMNG